MDPDWGEILYVMAVSLVSYFLGYRRGFKHGRKD